MKFKRAKSINPALNLTPLVDVVLNLILYFMVATTFVKSPGIKVDLPTARNAQKEIRSEVLVSLTKAGAIYVDEKRISEANLALALKGAVAKTPSKLVIIKADKEVRHGQVVKVMDIAQGIGARSLAIGVTITDLEGR
jgi:biopolymer transport protein ExbD